MNSSELKTFSYSIQKLDSRKEENVSILKEEEEEEESKRVHFQINHFYIEMEIVNCIVTTKRENRYHANLIPSLFQDFSRYSN